MASSTPSRSAYEVFRERIDDTILLAIAAASDEGIDPDEFMEREYGDAIARLAERDLVERVEDE